MPTSYSMYKYIGIALMSVFAIMMIPAQSQTSTGLTLYGMGSLILHDAAGNEIFTQTIHNRLLNEGESFLLSQTFQNTTAASADNIQMGVICVSNNASFAATDETLSAAAFDAADSLTASNCKEDTSVDMTTTPGTAIVLPSAFTTSNLDAAGEIIYGIGVCQARSGSDADFANCAAGAGGSGGLLFAAIDTSDVTLNTGESVTVTYTFDITSASS
jgi:hypothetical protein